MFSEVRCAQTLDRVAGDRLARSRALVPAHPHTTMLRWRSTFVSLPRMHRGPRPGRIDHMTAITGTPRPSEGLFASPRRVEQLADLLANIWQFGYVTSDLDRGLEELGGRFGLTHHFRVPTGDSVWQTDAGASPFEAKFAMAARGGLVVELIEPVSGDVDFYRQVLPDDGSFAIRLHHYAAFVQTGDAEWERLRALLRASDLDVDRTLVIPGNVRAGYIDTRPDLGHYLEICQIEPGHQEFFKSLVADSA
jgi:hypothetical protein